MTWLSFIQQYSFCFLSLLNELLYDINNIWIMKALFPFSDMIWFVMLLWVPLSTDAEIALHNQGQLVTVKLSTGQPQKLTVGGFVQDSERFIIPQCHSKRYNFTFKVDAVKEIDSSVGTVVADDILPNISVNNTRENLTFNVYCTYTNYSLTGTPSCWFIFIFEHVKCQLSSNFKISVSVLCAISSSKPSVGSLSKIEYLQMHFSISL